MKILVANNHLDNYGGSETFTYALIACLLKKNNEVDYFTFIKGKTSEKIEELGCQFFSKTNYDIVFANHISCVETLRYLLAPKTLIIQTCHGIFPALEQPSGLADAHVAISYEVKEHLSNLGFESKLIHNGIDCNRFTPKNSIKTKPKKLLSLCQSKEANVFIKKACEQLNIELITLNKHKNPIWNVEDYINECDIVIGLGRSAFEAFACGRPLIVFDNRPYFPSYADGYITQDNIEYSLKHNCSGRAFKHKFTVNDLCNEIKKYNNTDGEFLRKLALETFNIDNQIEKYIELASTISNSKDNEAELSSLHSKALVNIIKNNTNYHHFLLTTDLDKITFIKKEELIEIFKLIKTNLKLKNTDKRFKKVRKTISYKLFVKSELKMRS